MKQLRENPETQSFGTRWTSDEQALLIDSLSKHRDINDIAKDHKRTAGGIIARRNEIAVNMLSDTTIDKVCEILNMTCEEIDIAQKQAQKRANKKTAASTTVAIEVATPAKSIQGKSTAAKNSTSNILNMLSEMRETLARIETKLLDIDHNYPDTTQHTEQTNAVRKPVNNDDGDKRRYVRLAKNHIS